MLSVVISAVAFSFIVYGFSTFGEGSAAAIPVRENRPAPMTAPMPRPIKLQGPR